MSGDITELKRTLESRARQVAEYLLPRGVLHGNQWCVGNIQGDPGGSLQVCIHGSKVGVWKEFNADGESGDLIDLWCQVKHLSLVAALDDIRKWLGIEQPRFEKREKSYRRPGKPKGGAPRDAVLKYLTEERKLSEQALRIYQVGEDGRTVVWSSFLPDGQLAFVKYLGIDLLPTGKKNIRVEADCEPVLFGWQAIDPESREVTITEGEIDAVTAYDYGWAALSAPFGGGGGAKQKWIESEYDRLARFETIYLALDMDRAGEEAAAEIDPPPLKWSALSYGFCSKEDRDAEEELQAGRDRRQAAAG